MFFIDIANLGMANIALPTIQKDLGYDEGSLQWILTAYALAVGYKPYSSFLPCHQLLTASSLVDF